MLKAPFTDEQVLAILKYQYSGIMHPFTCGREHVYAHESGELPRELTSDDFDAIDDSGILGEAERFRVGHVTLMPTNRGLICPHDLCMYTQDWVHKDMADLEAVEAAIKRQEELYGAPLSEEDIKLLAEEFKNTGD